jgi:FMNH2-dependent dimethyl sulfone monooxygenase
MTRILTSIFAGTAFAGPDLSGRRGPVVGISDVAGEELTERLAAEASQAEAIGIDHLLIAQRWWGNAEEIEGSSYDCLAATAFFAAHTKRMRLITAIHPGFFQPTQIAKWGATIDRLTNGRWAINVTSGWNEEEFHQYGVDWLEHDERYRRSREFLEVVQGAWANASYDHTGHFYRANGLRLEPRPVQKRLEVWQGGQSPAAMSMAADLSDWMFLNGGPPEKIAGIISKVRELCAETGRQVRFALYALPVCRATDAEAEEAVTAMVEATDAAVIERRRTRVAGAQGMWAPSDDPLTHLDTNEGFASRLIGSPATILERIAEFHRLGVDCLHTALSDPFFNTEVLPHLGDLPHSHD